MDAIFIDSNGNKKNFLYQYDVGQSFVVENFEYSTAPKVQFSIKSIKTSPSVNSQLSNGNLTASIPDMLLTYGEDIIAYLYIQDATKGTVIETIFISVIPRKRPADYQYTSEMFARTVNGTTMSEDSSFGEVAVWSDENPNRENRDGYFVTASYGSDSIVISKANSISNVYGVAVKNVGFAANCTENKLDAMGNLLPKYEYVCTSGFAEVIDNGRCTVGGMCIPNTDGTARTPTNTNGYKVVARTDSKHIIIFVDVSMQTINGLQTSINNLNSNLSSHKNDKSNPHETTKAQVGLSEVPNVATNDQTPTYTEATELAQLSSGEKLSIAFGKLSKAVTDFIAHLANKSNPHSVTKAQVGLGNCDNTSDIDKPVSTAQETAINTVQTNLNNHKDDKGNPHTVTKAQVGLGNCDNTSDVDKPVSTAQAAEISRVEGLANAAQSDIDTHSARTDNPHSVTKAQVGLGNCDNTSDINKPVSTAQATAIADAKKAGTDAQSAIDTHKADYTNPHQVTKAQVGLGNCDNTSDTNKPISTAQSAEFTRIEGLVNDAQSDIDTHVARTDNPHGVTKAQVGLGNVDNTADIDKPISTAQSEEFTRIEGLISTAQGDTDGHAARTDNPHNVTKTQVGLGNVDNTSDADKPISTATQTALDKKADLVNGLVPLSQLPSQVKEMRVVATIAERDAITNKFENLRVYVKDASADSTVSSGGADYLYDGSQWVKTSESESLDLVLSWENVSGKPTEFTPATHTHTKDEVGLANVDNTADLDKPISTATQKALDAKPTMTDGKISKDVIPYDVNCAWDNVIDKPTEFAPSVHANSHASTGTDPIAPSDIGAVAQSDFETLQNKVNALSITDFVLTDATTGTQYTIGVDNGVIILNEVL